MSLRLLILQVEKISYQIVSVKALVTDFFLITRRTLVRTSRSGTCRGERHIHYSRLNRATRLHHTVRYTGSRQSRLVLKNPNLRLGNTTTNRTSTTIHPGGLLFTSSALISQLMLIIATLGRQEGHAAILLIVLVVMVMVMVMAISGRSGSLVGPIVLRRGQRRVVVALGGDHELARLLQVSQRLQLFALLGGKLRLLQSAVKLMLHRVAADGWLLLLLILIS